MLHAMGGFGETLRQERESRGYTLESLSEATKVGLPLLEALETNDFARLPGGPFNHGFVRAIARTLDLDPELVIEAYDQEAKSQGIRTPDPSASMAPAPRRVEVRSEDGRRVVVLDWTLARAGLVVAAALMLVALIFITLAILRQDNSPARVATDQDSPIRPPPVESAPADSAPAPPEPIPAAPPSPSATETAPTPAAIPEAVPDRAPDKPSGLRVTDSGVGTNVVGNELRGETDRFREGAQVYFWTRALGGRSGDRLYHVWMHDGRTIHTQEIDLGGSHWRAFSGKRMRPGSTGEWVVEARDEAGRVLARQEFTCTS